MPRRGPAAGRRTPPAIRAYAADLLAASAQVDDLGTFVAGDARIGDWTGLGSTSYHEAIRPIGRTADAMSLALRGVARRADDHADTHAAAASTAARRSSSERAHLVATIAALRDRVAAATGRGGRRRSRPSATTARAGSAPSRPTSTPGRPT